MMASLIPEGVDVIRALYADFERINRVNIGQRSDV